ncbi:alpha/beta fold hydrolase [Paraflavitalea pollutisoli]|uniref:alpha/beta fold hydrolase n=1 Tax=Paraflavitalea pollutisoli TaxID=3034143 RepID=UPI0023EB27EE|nr:alpha/beta hydrolase [Paraflavitalea sp. H1-2-19X]
MKKILRSFALSLLASLSVSIVAAQGKIQKLPLGDPTAWQIYNRELQTTTKDSVALQAGPGDGMYIWKNACQPSAIEFDVRGDNFMNQSFVGFAFNIQDNKQYEVIYLRPFNFFNPDTVRRWRAVQYVYMPDHPWEKLRAETPGKYENRIVQPPNPDKWFHVKITIQHPVIKVYVNRKAEPSLVVNSLAPNTPGKIGLWVGNMARGSFSNVVVLHGAASTSKSPAAGKPVASTTATAPYGNNPAAGKYLTIGDTKLYYETYGKGSPVLLLHGGVYGYIDEFQPLIDSLRQKHQVICLATRGHGKSDIGHAPYSWLQRAEDAYTLIKVVTRQKVTVIGFSDGGAAAFKLAVLHPEVVGKLVAIGFGDAPKGRFQPPLAYSPEMLLGQAKQLFESRLALMPEPQRWAESLNWLNALYNEDLLSTETFSRVKCPTLVMTGDKDVYHAVDQVKIAADAIPGSQLAVIPACGHVVINCNFPLVWQHVAGFLSGKAG